MVNIKVVGGALFSILVFTLIFNAIEPELTGALLKLEGNMICPPELAESDFNICFSPDGEVIIDGNLKKDLELELEGKICNIPAGEYNNINLCVLGDFWSGKKLYVTGMGLFNKKTITISKIISYAKAGKYIKLLRFAKYIPK